MTDHRTAFIGNAPMVGNPAASIDACERVVRFNDAHGFGGATGSRVTELYLVNRGGAPAEWLDDPALGARPAVAATPRVVLPLHPDSDYLGVRRSANGRVHRDDRDHTRALVERLCTPERAVDILGAAVHERACRALGLTPDGADERRPSTGFVALHHHLVARGPRGRTLLYGFTFEGWEGHPWQREREWIAAREAEGAVTLVPVGLARGPNVACASLKRSISGE